MQASAYWHVPSLLRSNTPEPYRLLRFCCVLLRSFAGSMDMTMYPEV